MIRCMVHDSGCVASAVTSGDTELIPGAVERSLEEETLWLGLQGSSRNLESLPWASGLAPAPMG